jgi:hypothetical protein
MVYGAHCHSRVGRMGLKGVCERTGSLRFSPAAPALSLSERGHLETGRDPILDNFQSLLRDLSSRIVQPELPKLDF